MKEICIEGARTHNLQNVHVTLPRDALVVFTGLSGSGKSSLAFDTLYAEGQRRYVESLSAYARQFLSLMEKPDVDQITGLSPAIAIEQKSTSNNPRSTVGTVTEIYDYLRLLYARAGEPRCPEHHQPLKAQTLSQMADIVEALPEGTKISLLAPVIQHRKGEHKERLDALMRSGFVRFQIDGHVYDDHDLPILDKKKKHTIEVVVDRFSVRPGLRGRITDSLEHALILAEGKALLVYENPEGPQQVIFSSRFACTSCGYALQELEPRMFSFNNPSGACPACEGLGTREVFDANKIVRQPASSLAAGALYGWNKQHAYLYQILKSLASAWGFSLSTPFSELDASIQRMLLHGATCDDRDMWSKAHDGVEAPTFEGVVPYFERRLEQAPTEALRDEIRGLMTELPCPSCQGHRLRPESLSVFVSDMPLHHVVTLSIQDALSFFDTLKLSGSQAKIAARIIKEIQTRLHFLDHIGLSYLTLNRSADSLSGGEAQRIRLASQMGAGLMGVMYVLDEPSIGLHPRDNKRLLGMLRQLRDLGNTLIVVEHDEETILHADHVLDLGPGAGVHGGHVVAQGTPEDIKNSDSLTGDYLSGKKRIAINRPRQKADDRVVVIKGAHGHNLRDVTVTLPVGLFTCITGVSGSGKSTLINRTLLPEAAHVLNGALPAAHRWCHGIEGLEHLDKVLSIDQSPIGRTPRSNPATYTGLFTPIRELFSQTEESRARGYAVGRFSFNVRGGRCEHCQGDGVMKIEMHFLADMYVTCDVCHGTRYNQQTLEVRYKGKNIHDVLSMTVEEATEFFKPIPSIHQKLATLMQVGLGYIQLGQSATTLSGGEAQRIKLAKELSRRSTGRTLYILDEPTTGLHFHDVQMLLEVLHSLQQKGNTLVVIEHNVDVIKTADWVIDLGPEGGSGGGYIVAEGTPEGVAKNPKSITGPFLQAALTQRA